MSGTKNEKIIWDAKTKYVLKKYTNEKIIPNDWMNLMLGNIPVYTTFNEGRYAVSVVSMLNQKQGQKLYEMAGIVDINFMQSGQTGDGLYDNKAYIDIWDLNNGSIIRRFPTTAFGWLVHTKNVEKLALPSADGKEIYIIETLSGNILHRIECSIPTKCVAIHPLAEKIIVVGADHSVRELDLNTGNLTATMPFDSLKEFVLGYSPDGQHLLTCNYEHYISSDYEKMLTPVLLEYHGQKKKSFGQIKLWNIASGKIQKIFKGHCGLVRKIDFHEDTSANEIKMLTGADNGEIFEWNYRTTERIIAIAKWFCKKRKKTGKKTDFGDNVSGKI